MIDQKQYVLFLICELCLLLHGSYVCLVGFVVVVLEYDLFYSYDDFDVFCYGNLLLIVMVQYLLDYGFEFVLDNEVMKFDRWLVWDLNIGWCINFIKFCGMFDGFNQIELYEVNVVYKMFEKQLVKCLFMVLELFDFGYLVVGYELWLGDMWDMCFYFFLYMFDFNVLLLLFDCYDWWVNGLIIQYMGIC